MPHGALPYLRAGGELVTVRDDADAPIATLDPRRPHIITIVGRKRSGKSVLASRLWASYPYDRICIDPTHDADVGDIERQHITRVHELPARWPLPDEGQSRVSIDYRPDAGADTYVDDLDRAAGMAFLNPRGHCMLWIDEIGEITTASRTGPHMRRVLTQSRHRGVTLLSCGPRAKGVNPLLFSQADYLYIFDLPGVLDRQRIAETIGVDEKALSAAIFGLPEHGYLRWDATTRDMTEWPPLPYRAPA